MATFNSQSVAVTVLLCAVLLLIATLSMGQSPDCLGCICQASSQCNTTIGCSSHAGYHCGPFLISWSFWKDAGQPVLTQGDNPDRKGAFEDCANDIYCAADTVALYLKKFHQDCNGDGQVTCLDYAMIHKVGGYGCKVPVPSNHFFDAFNECLAFVGEI